MKKTFLISALFAISTQVCATPGSIIAAISSAADAAIKHEARRQQTDRDIAEGIGNLFSPPKKNQNKRKKKNRTAECYCSKNFKQKYIQSKFRFDKSKHGFI